MKFLEFKNVFNGLRKTSSSAYNKHIFKDFDSSGESSSFSFSQPKRLNKLAVDSEEKEKKVFTPKKRKGDTIVKINYPGFKVTFFDLVTLLRLKIQFLIFSSNDLFSVFDSG